MIEEPIFYRLLLLSRYFDPVIFRYISVDSLIIAAALLSVPVFLEETAISLSSSTRSLIELSVAFMISVPSAKSLLLEKESRMLFALLIASRACSRTPVCFISRIVFSILVEASWIDSVVSLIFSMFLTNSGSLSLSTISFAAFVVSKILPRESCTPGAPSSRIIETASDVVSLMSLNLSANKKIIVRLLIEGYVDLMLLQEIS